MQFTAVTAIAFLAAAVSAAPTVATTTVQFTNDSSGRSANVNVPLSGTQQSVSALLAGSALDVNHTDFATSFFLQSNFQGVYCSLYLPGTSVNINGQHTFAGFAPVSNPLDLAGSFITCYCVV